MNDTEKRPMGRPSQYGPRQNVTMAWPVEIVPQIDAAARAAGLTRTEYILQAAREKIAREARKR